MIDKAFVTDYYLIFNYFCYKLVGFLLLNNKKTIFCGYLFMFFNKSLLQSNALSDFNKWHLI